MELLYPCFICYEHVFHGQTYWSVVRETPGIWVSPRLFEVKGQGHSLFPMSCFSTCTDAAADTFLRKKKNPFRVWCCPPGKSWYVVPVEIWDFYRFSWFLAAKICILTFWCSTFSTYLRIENRGSTVANLQDRMKSKRSTATDQRPASQLAIEPRQAKPVDG